MLPTVDLVGSHVPANMYRVTRNVISPVIMGEDPYSTMFRGDTKHEDAPSRWADNENRKLNVAVVTRPATLSLAFKLSWRGAEKLKKILITFSFPVEAST